MRKTSGVPPLVSVVIATHFRNHLLQDAIESALEQQYEPMEVIVVDDSGNGHAEPVIDRYETVRGLIRDENGGWAAAYTDGIRAANGTYIHLLDDDDYFLPGKLEHSVAAIERHDDAGVVYTGMEQDTLGPVYPDPAVRGDILERALAFRTFPCCTITMLIDRTLLTELLPLSPIADDLLLKIELARRTEFQPVEACLVYRRKEQSRKWVGLEKFAEMKRIVHHQRDLYEKRPDIRRAVLAERYEEEGQFRLEQQLWSAQAIYCFLKAAYYAEDARVRCGGQMFASLLGRPGWLTAQRARAMFAGN